MARRPRVDFTPEDRTIIIDMIKARIEKPDYSDKDIVREVNDKDLLVGKKIKVVHVASIRRQLGLRKPSKKGGTARSTKTMETHPGPTAKRGRNAKKDRTVGDNHPITLADLIQAAEEAKIAGEKAVEIVEQYVEQEKERVGI